MLVVKLQIGMGNRIRVKHAVSAIILSLCALGANAPVNDKMPDMDVVRVQFAGQ